MAFQPPMNGFAAGVLVGLTGIGSGVFMTRLRLLGLESRRPQRRARISPMQNLSLSSLDSAAHHSG